jgi:hypothetical protein
MWENAEGVEVIKGQTHLLMPSYPAPIPTWSSPATSRMWVTWSETYKTLQERLYANFRISHSRYETQSRNIYLNWFITLR